MSLHLIEDAIEKIAEDHEANRAKVRADYTAPKSTLFQNKASKVENSQRSILDAVSRNKAAQSPVQKAPEIQWEPHHALPGMPSNVKPATVQNPSVAENLASKAKSNLNNAGSWIKANKGKAGLIGAGLVGGYLMSRKKERQGY